MRPSCPYCDGERTSYVKRKPGGKQFVCLDCKREGRAPKYFIIDGEGNVVKKGKKKDRNIPIPKGHTEFKKERNNAQLESVSERILTAGQLLKKCQVDTEEWKVDREVVNKWDVATKQKDGTSRITELYQIKLWLSKYEPDEQLFPVVNCVRFNLKAHLPKTDPSRTYSKDLIVGDAHIGFLKDIDTGNLDPMHDRVALDIVRQVLEIEGPNRLIILGDMLDLPEWSSKFIRSPEFYWTTQPALIELGWWLSQWRKASPDTEVIYLEGNHCDRMRKAVVTNLIASYGLRPINQLKGAPVMSLEYLLNLEEMGIEFIDNYPASEYWLDDNLRCSHGFKIRQRSGDTVKMLLSETRYNEIVGHIHRQEYACKTVHLREPVTVRVFSPGTLCRVDGVVPSQTGRENWQQGIGMVYHGSGTLEISPVAIEDGKASFHGKVYRGEDLTKQLTSDTGWEY